MTFDFHTHNLAARSALISVEPGFAPRQGAVYSVGIHPWRAADADEGLLRALAADARRDCVLAIGETGLDRLHAAGGAAGGAALEAQAALLRRHVALSEELGKPLVLHVVRAFPEAIALRRELRPRQPWVVHGFRGKRQLAEELLREGFYLSLGARYNADAARVIPSSRLLVETDESAADIAALAAALPQLDRRLALRLLGLPGPPAASALPPGE